MYEKAADLTIITNSIIIKVQFYRGKIIMSYNTVSAFLGSEKESPETYNFEFENCEAFKSMDPIERFFTYQASAPEMLQLVYPHAKMFAQNVRQNPDFQNISDCDGSGNGNNALIHDVYHLLWGWNKNASDTFGKVDLPAFSCEFGGETIHSVNTFLKTSLSKRSIGACIEEYADPDTKSVIVEKIENIPGLSDYIGNYHTLGNFTLVPRGFNNHRGRVLSDKWDLSLECLASGGYHGFDRSEFIRYVNYFYLWIFFDKNGNILRYSEKNDYYVTAKRLILERGKFMSEMLKLGLNVGEKAFSDIRGQVLGSSYRIFSGTDEVWEAINKVIMN